MDKVYDDTKRLLEREMQEIAQKNAISMEDLKTMGELLDNLKDLSIVCAMEESGYSETMVYDSDASFARGRGVNAMRDSRGRYMGRSYDNGYNMYDNGSYNMYRNSYENGGYRGMGQNEMR